MPEKEGDSKNSFHQLLPRFSYGFFFFFLHILGELPVCWGYSGNGRGGCVGRRLSWLICGHLCAVGRRLGKEVAGNYNRQGGDAGKLASGIFLLSLWPTNGARETEVPGSIHLRPGSWFQPCTLGHQHLEDLFLHWLHF